MVSTISVYERFIASMAQSVGLDHAKEFLLAAVVKCTVADLKPYIDILNFVPPPPQGTSEWAKDHKTWFFLMANTQHAPTAPPLPPQLQGIPFAQVQQLLVMLKSQ